MLCDYFSQTVCFTFALNFGRRKEKSRVIFGKAFSSKFKEPVTYLDVRSLYKRALFRLYGD